MHHGASWVSLKGQSGPRRANQWAGGQVPRGRGRSLWHLGSNLSTSQFAVMQAPEDNSGDAGPAKIGDSACNHRRQKEALTGGGAISAPDEPQSLEVAEGSVGQESRITQCPRVSLPIVEGQMLQAQQAFYDGTQARHNHSLELYPGSLGIRGSCVEGLGGSPVVGNGPQSPGLRKWQGGCLSACEEMTVNWPEGQELMGR